MAHSTPFLIILSTLLLPSPSSGIAGNILFTGEIYTLAGDILSIPMNAFFRNNDWNLAFNKDCRSRSDCTLHLTDRGQLLIRSPDSSTFWSSSPPRKTGRYAAVFRHDGHVTLYGPSIWSTPHRGSAASRAAGVTEVRNSPHARNLMFSSQVLGDSSKLANREHVLLMREDCNLELVTATEEIVWESGTKGMGRNCFVRLDHRGQLAVVDDKFKVVWATEAEEEEGFYVLIVQNDGQAAVYGPAIWSTSVS